MGNKVKVQTQVLIDEIIKSSEYTDFISLKAAIVQDKEIFNNVNKYRKHLFELQCLQATTDVNQYDAITELNANYEQLLSRPAVSDFMKAELKLTKLISSVFDEITQGLEMDLEFLA